MFDCSSFMDIFDVDHFIDVLKNDISIVKELPKELLMFDCITYLHKII